MSQHLARRSFAAAVFGALVSTIAFSQGGEKSAVPESSPVAAPGERAESAKRYVRIGDLKGVQAVTRFSERLLRGAQPDGVEGMEALKKLGVDWVLSVEEPDAKENAAAKAVGLRVVNIPTEYSGFDDDVVKRIVEAVRAEGGTSYVHCHHGKHRGGAAASILRMTFEGVSTDEAIAELKELGCSPRYPGLYETVRRYRPDPAAAHRVVKPLPGVGDALEITPRLFRSAAVLDAEALASFKKLGVEAIVTAGISADAKAAAIKAGFEVIETNLEAKAVEVAWKALEGLEKKKVLAHAGGDAASAATIVAAFRLRSSLWSHEEAAKEIEGTVATESGRARAAAIRALAAK